MSETKPQVADDTEEPTVPTGGRPSGPDVIAAYLKTLPSSPGVYRMIDAAGDVIYVGKARSLKARVSNYARLNGNSNRIVRMIMNTVAMEFVTVRTEAEALLLEANLIKRFRPRYNVLMRDDKSFPYILIARDHKAPQILKHRGARNRKGDFFGPFASAGAVNRTVNMLQRAFLLRSCSDSVFDARTRPCLLFQIKRCAGPCTGEISPEDYAKLVDESVQFLRGESQNVRRMYQRLMTDAADKLEFEEAAKFRNRLWALAHVTADQTINPEGIEEADVFAAVQEGGQTCIQVFFFRTGQNWGNRAYYPRADRSLDVTEVLDSFIAQFYDDKPVPRLILLSHEVPSQELLSEALSIKADRKVEIRCPQRGNKTGLVEHALQNAREALARKMAETSSQRTLLAGVAERFGLAKVPRRIEVYDNSHISGTNAVGGMIVAGPEGMVKNQYRKFNIKSDAVTPGDDYAMMREVFTRRFKRVADELREAVAANPELPTSAFPEAVSAVGRSGYPGSSPDEVGQSGASHDGVKTPDIQSAPMRRMDSGEAEVGEDSEGEMPDAEPHVLDETDDDSDSDGVLDTSAFPTIPDLILVDGGAGQLAVAREVLAEFGLTDIIPVVGVAKGPDRDAGREHFHVPGKPRSFMLEPRDPVLYFVQRLRDEAHRFAIGTHRAKRAKALGVNPLDEIEGIGPTRKRALLTHFGSAKSVSRAGVEDLKAVPGISAQMAQAIYDFFHDGKGEDSRGTRNPDQ
jgi:excinuclease ABC subunit C